MIRYLLTADINTFIRPFVHCAFLLAMATLIRTGNIYDTSRTNAAAEQHNDYYDVAYEAIYTL